MNLSKIFLLLVSIIFYNASYCQQSKVPQITEKDTSYFAEDVDERASFDGLYEFLSGNIKYPKKEKRKKIEGIVHISFNVEMDGSLSQITVAKAISTGLDNECLRIMKLISKKGQWTPAKKNGKAVRQKYILPFAFKIEE